MWMGHSLALPSLLCPDLPRGSQASPGGLGKWFRDNSAAPGARAHTLARLGPPACCSMQGWGNLINTMVLVILMAAANQYNPPYK